MNALGEQTGLTRAATWMVGERLACVLHVGDSSLAYQLSDQGHEVVVAGEDVRTRRNDDVQYVRCAGDRLPFASAAFDAVVVPHFAQSAVAISEFARVLVPGGLLSTLSHRPDDSVPWMRRLREIIGMPDSAAPTTTSLVASGLFDEPEVITSGSWERLNLEQFLQFAHAHRDSSVPDSAVQDARTLFAEYAGLTGTLQLRHETACARARVDKSQLPPEPTHPETVLFDLQ